VGSGDRAGRGAGISLLEAELVGRDPDQKIIRIKPVKYSKSVSYGRWNLPNLGKILKADNLLVKYCIRGTYLIAIRMSKN
jgi:hypothetical protein